uniref:Uncharacterized protein n=1 Tax=Oryza glumipatula TaxID=40148 RepID=A0A0D9YJC6_9ORYZ
MRLSTKTRRQREGDARRHCRRRKVAAACRFIFSERLAGHPWGERMGGDGRNAGSDLHAPPIRGIWMQLFYFVIVVIVTSLMGRALAYTQIRSPGGRPRPNNHFYLIQQIRTWGNISTGS